MFIRCMNEFFKRAGPSLFFVKGCYSHLVSLFAPPIFFLTKMSFMNVGNNKENVFGCVLGNIYSENIFKNQC